MKLTKKLNCKTLLAHLCSSHKDSTFTKSVTRASESISSSFKENAKHLIFSPKSLHSTGSKFSIKYPVLKQKNIFNRQSVTSTQDKPKHNLLIAQRIKLACNTKQKNRAKLMKSQNSARTPTLTDTRLPVRSLSNKSNKKSKKATKKGLITTSKNHTNKLSLETANSHKGSGIAIRLNALKERLKRLLVVDLKATVTRKP